MKKILRILVVVAFVAMIVYILRPRTQDVSHVKLRTFPSLTARDAEKRAMGGKYLGCWATLQDYEKITGKKIDSFSQSPFLDKQKLPPVKERISDEPLVVWPLEGNGKYGGVLNLAGGKEGVLGLISNPRIFAHDRDFITIAPDLAKAWHFENDKKTLVISLRKGLKWSDGHPFTTDDIMFWYEHLLQNKEFTGEYPAELVVDGELVKITRDRKDPKHTFRIAAKGPIPLLELFLAHWSGQQSNYEHGFYDCAHYMKQFHPAFIGQKEAKRKALEAGHSTWVQHYISRQHIPENPPEVLTALGTPVMGSYVLKSFTQTEATLERNPYYYKIDPAGQQLPYIDKYFVRFSVEKEVAKLNILNGDVDLSIFGLTPEDAPTVIKYQQRGGYRALIWKRLWGSYLRYAFNLNHDNLAKRKIFADLRFRKAMSLAMDRQEINDNIFFGNAVVAQATVAPDTRYSLFYEEAFGKSFANHDPAEANRLLDEMGLTKRDSDGNRLDHDGKPFTVILMHVENQLVSRLSIHELVQEYWGKVGIRMIIDIVSGNEMLPKLQTGDYDATLWHMDGVSDVRFPTMPFAFVPMDARALWAPTWARNYVTKQEQTDLPQEVKNLYVWYKKMQQAPTIEDRVKYGKLILKSQADNLWSIGTVSLPPQIAIANQFLRNMPETTLTAWDNFYLAPLPPECLWFDNEERRNVTLKKERVGK